LVVNCDYITICIALNCSVYSYSTYYFFRLINEDFTQFMNFSDVVFLNLQYSVKVSPLNHSLRSDVKSVTVTVRSMGRHTELR
jgi:hypothetical protein